MPVTTVSAPKIRLMEKSREGLVSGGIRIGVQPPALQCLIWCVCVFSYVQLFMTPCQAPLSMDFPRQEYWSGLPCPPPEYLPDLGIEPMSPASPALQADSLQLSHMIWYLQGMWLWASSPPS